MSQLTLWKMDLSPPARAVMVLADLLGLNFEYIDVDFMNNEHKSPEFMKLNPLGTLPLLRDGDFYLSDSHAMMKYLLAKYGADHHEKLYPSDLKTRALVDQCLFFDTGVYFITLKIITLPSIYEGLQGPTERHLERIESCYSVVESYLGDKQYIATDHFTLADISVGMTTVALQAILKLDKERYSRTSSWLERLHEIPDFFNHANVLGESLSEVISSLWEKNKQQ